MIISNRNLAENGDEVTDAFEVRTKIKYIDSDDVFSYREYDEVIRIDREVLNLEAKAWAASYLDSGLRRVLGVTNANDNGEGRDRVGQMLSDIVAFRNNEDVFDVRWEFSPELAEAGITETDIANKMLKLIDENPVIRSNVQRSTGISDPTKSVTEVEQEWIAFLEIFESAVHQDLFRIEDYGNIRRELGF